MKNSKKIPCIKTLLLVVTLSFSSLATYECRGETTDTTLDSTRNVAEIPQIQGTDMYGNTLGDEFYIYRSLLNDVHKKAYDQLYAGLVQCQDTAAISVNITPDDLYQIRAAVLGDHPELFWVGTSYNYHTNDQGYITEVILMYNDLVYYVQHYYSSFYRCALTMCQNAAKYPKKVDQVKYINDLMCNLITYQLNAPYHYTAYSSLVNCSTVCAGYAKGFQYCMQLLGIPAYYVTGYVGEEYHSWNLVQLDGEYYNIDVSWNDVYPIATQYRYDYFNVTDAQISRDHQRAEMSVYFPTATGTKYSFDKYYRGRAYGSDFTNYEINETLSFPFIGDTVASIIAGNYTPVDSAQSAPEGQPRPYAEQV